jgi:hypothetical protein
MTESTKSLNNKVEYKKSLELAKRQYLLEIQEVWYHIQMLVIAFSFAGLIFATLLGASGYIFYSDQLIRMMFMSGAMGCLVSTTIGINIVARLKEKKYIPYLPIIFFLTLLISALLVGFVKAKEGGITTAWPPLAGGFYAAIMTGIIWRLRSTAKEFKKIEKLLLRE